MEKWDILRDSLLQLGASEQGYEFNSAAGRQITPAYVVRGMQQREGVDFQRANRDAARRCSATLVLSVQPIRAFTPDEINASFAAGIKPTANVLVDLWLIFNRSFECQLSVLDAFGYSDGSSQAQRRSCDLKKVLGLINSRYAFVFSKVGLGLAVLEFDKPPSEVELFHFFDAVLEFKKEYEGLDISPGHLKQLICETGVLVL